MSLSSVNSVVESGWRARGGERSEPERDRQLDSTPPPGGQSILTAGNGGQPVPTGSGTVPDPQVAPKVTKAKRRKFSASDKRRILEAVDQATEPGAIGRILRREGIYHSQLSKWRQQRSEAISAGLASQPRGAKGPSVKTLQLENRKLQRENARLHQQLDRAEIIIEFQKKAAALFETTKVTEES